MYKTLTFIFVYGILSGVEVIGEVKQEYLQILTFEALEFLADLHRRFNYARKQVLKKRI
jgi:malate synthase